MKKISVKRLAHCPKRDTAVSTLYNLYYDGVLACSSSVKLDCYQVISDMVKLDSRYNDYSKFLLFKVSQIKF